MSIVTTQPKAVSFGDHLFIANDTNAVNEQHQGLVKTTKEVKDVWRHRISEQQSRLNDRGIRFVFALAPDKQSVYRHLLPPTFNTRQTEYLMDLEPVLDLSSPLSGLAQISDVYPRTDSHWNHLGALIASQCLMARLGMPGMKSPLTWRCENRSGDLGHKIKPHVTSEFLFAKFRTSSVLVYDNLVPNNGRILIYYKLDDYLRREEAPKKLLIFGDSFSYYLVNFLKESFDLVVQVHSVGMDQRIIDTLRPDCVVAEITERFMIQAPNVSDMTPLDALLQNKVDTRTRLEPDNRVTTVDLKAFPGEISSIVRMAEAILAPFAGLLAEL